MKNVYDEIVGILSSKSEKLGMNASVINYSSKSDPGSAVPGYTTQGVSETINIPEGYMKRAGASSAQGFLNW